MRQVAMFVVGFAVVAAAGVAATQMAVVAGSGPASPDWAPEEPVSAPAGADARPPDREAVTAAPRAESASEEESLILEIDDPQDGLRTDAVEVVLTGRTSPGAHVWSGEHVAVVDPEGGWSLTVPLVRGKNVLFVGALRGDLTTTVTTTIIQGEELVWAIHQKVRASETPFEKFFGTGSPGMVITASSRYGSAATTIGASGEWVLGVEFTSEPGTDFPISVSTSTGWTKTYSFSHLGRQASAPTGVWAVTQVLAENSAPYAKFHGTGPTGTKVVASSPFGSAETHVGKDGKWLLKVMFDLSSAAAFDVQLTNSLGFARSYPFTYAPISSHDFEVTQMYGTGAQASPFEHFTGKTAPYTWVKAVSAHGWAKVESDADGRFELIVHFDGAPVDTAFPVEVIDGRGNREVFSFTSTSSP